MTRWHALYGNLLRVPRGQRITPLD